MALLDFPSGPGTGDTYTLNGNMWKWNGTSWVAFNSLSLSSQVTGILAVQYGGTGFGGTYTAGDILYALSSNTFGKLAAGTAGSVLASGGPSTAPYWKVDDTGAGTVGAGTSGGFSYYTSTTNITSGSGFSYISGSNNVILTNGLLSLTGSTVNSGTWAGNAITAKYGGTGLNALSAGDLIYGSATDTYSRLTHSGTAGSILVTTASSGLAWSTAGSLSVGTAASSASVVTDASTSVRYLIGTVLNIASTGGTVLSTGSGITITNNLLTSAGIAVTGSTASTSTSTGALIVTGGVGIGGSLWTTSGNLSSVSGVSHQSGAITGGTWAGTAVSLTYGGTNANLTASAGAIVYSTSTAFALSAVGTAGSILQSANTGAPIWVGQSTLSVGTATSAAQVNIAQSTAARYLIGVNSNSSANSAQLSTGSGVSVADNLLIAGAIGVTNATASTSTTTGALTVSGGVGIGGSLWTASGNLSSISGVSHQNGAITGGTWAGTAVSLTYGGTNANLTASAGAIVYSTSTAFALSAVGTAGSILQSANTGAPIWVGQSTLSVGTATSSASVVTDASTSVRYLIGTVLNIASTGGTVLSTGSGITITNNLLTSAGIAVTGSTASTSTSTGALIVTGGVGIGGSLWTTSGNLSSVSGVSLQSGAITGGTWAGTAVSLTYGGTNANLTASAGAIVYSTSTAFALSAVGTAGSILQSANTGAPIWVGQSTLSAGTAATSTTSINLNTYALSGTMYLTGQSSSSGAASGASQLVGSGISFNSVSGLLTATSYAGSGILLSGIVTSLAGSTGISVNSATGAVTVTNTGVISLIGTANQVLVAGGSGSATSGNITLTLPQSIGTGSTVSFADLNLTTGSSSTLTTVGSQPTSMINKQYVDNLASGLDIHGSVRAIAASGLGASYIQSSIGGSTDATGAYLISTSQVALSVDGVTFVATGATQRVLVAGGIDGKVNIGGTGFQASTGISYLANGIYFVTAVGSGSSNWILTRATDTDTNTELTAGTFTFVEEGTSYADTGWVCTNDTTNLGPIGFGITQISFTQFTGGGALTMGQGLLKSGNNIATKVNLSSTGAASGTGFTQFNIGGASGGGVADTGHYPTFSVRTSGTVAGTAVLQLNSDGFSLVGSTSTPRTITVTGSDITLTGGGNTLTLTGNISLPTPQQYRLAWGVSGTAISFLPAGTASSVLFQTNNSTDPSWVGQSALVVGGATTAANIQGGAAGSILYQTGPSTTGFFSHSGTAGSILVTVGSSGLAWTVGSSLIVGTATSAVTINTEASTAIRYLIGTASNTASGNTQLSTGSGITITNNLLTSAGIAVTGSTASTSTSTGALIVTGGVGIGGSLWTTSGNLSSVSGVSLQSGAITGGTWAGTAVSLTYGGTNANLTASAGAIVYSTSTAFALSAVGTAGSILQSANTGAPIWVGQSTLSVGTATSSASVVTDASTSVRYLIGTVLNIASTGGTVLSTGSGITITNNLLTSAGIAVTGSTASTSTSTGALIVTGGVGIGGSLWTTSGNLSSVSGVSLQSGAITGGTWAGTAVSLTYGGTNANLTASAGAIVYSTSTAFALSAVGTAGSILQSANTGAPIWVGQSTLSVGTATSAAQVNIAQSTAARYLIGVNSNSSANSAQLSTGSGVSVADNLLIAGAIGVTNATASTSTTTGALTVSGGVGVGGSLWTASGNLSSVSGVSLQSGAITGGTWAGTAVSLTYGGTNNTVSGNGYSSKVAVYNAAGTAITALTHTQGSVIFGATGGTYASIGSSLMPVAYISDTAPAIPGGAIGNTQAGQLWWDSYFGVLKVYYADGTSNQWVDATPVLGSSGGGSSTKRSYVMTFGAGFTPSTGADTVQILIPYAPDNTSKYYYIKRLDYRANTAGTGVSFYIERFTGGNAAFDVSTGNRIHSASGASFVAASGLFITSYTQSSSGASFVSSSGIAGSILSGDYLRLNFSHINSAANMSVSMIIEEQ